MAERDIGYLLKNINDKLKARADAELSCYNITLTQSRVLAYLEERGGQAMQKEIEQFLEVSHPTVVGLVSRLEQRGFVAVAQDQSDRRNKQVSLTKQARSLGQDMEQHKARMERALLAGLSTGEVEQLRRTLLIIYRNISQNKSDSD